ncbi:hypothetical protein BDQ17DRAFT_1173140, partial [Cyathus striatus]
GRLGGAVQSQAKHTNWFNPVLWILIDKAMCKADWSASAALHILQCNYEKLFKQLDWSILWKWKEKTKKNWKEGTLQKVKDQHTLTGTGQTGILIKYPDIVKEIKQSLQDFHTFGLPVNVVMGRSLMLTIINKHQPSLLSVEFCCSE